MRRSTVLNLPLVLVFPGLGNRPAVTLSSFADCQCYQIGRLFTSWATFGKIKSPKEMATFWAIFYLFTLISSLKILCSKYFKISKVVWGVLDFQTELWCHFFWFGSYFGFFSNKLGKYVQFFGHPADGGKYWLDFLYLKNLSKICLMAPRHVAVRQSA
jgi:hypothetical protein